MHGSYLSDSIFIVPADGANQPNDRCVACGEGGAHTEARGLGQTEERQVCSSLSLHIVNDHCRHYISGYTS